MGIFGKIFGPPADPSGESRELFLATAKAAMHMFHEGKIQAAMEFVARFIQMQKDSFGAMHPDVGRGALLFAAMHYISGDNESAAEFVDLAVENLWRSRDGNDPDALAAADLQDRLLAIERGEEPTPFQWEVF